jgi:hypothetical protein
VARSWYIRFWNLCEINHDENGLGLWKILAQCLAPMAISHGEKDVSRARPHFVRRTDGHIEQSIDSLDRKWRRMCTSCTSTTTRADASVGVSTQLYRHSCVSCLALIVCVQVKSFILLSFFCSLHLSATRSLSAKLAVLCALTENPNLPFTRNIPPSS